MSRPSRTGFAKREKERARFEKRQSKLARRQKAKAEGDASAPPEALEENAAAPAEPDEERPG